MMGFCGNRDNALSVKEGVIRNECYIDVLNLVPHGIFSMFSLFILIVWNRSSLGNMEAKTWVHFRGHTVRWIVTLLLILNIIISLLEGIMAELADTDTINLHVIVPQCIALVGTLLSIIFYHNLEQWNSPKFLLSLILYWTSCVVLKVLKYISLDQNKVTLEHIRMWVTWIDIAIYLVLLMTEIIFLFIQRYAFFSNPIPVRPSPDLGKSDYIFSHVNLMSKITCFWILSLLRQGYKHPLEQEHLGDLPESELSSTNYKKLKAAFEFEKSKAELKGEQPSFHKIYLRAFWPILALAGLLRLFGDMLAFVGPWCVEHVVAYAYKETKSRDLPVPSLTNQNASLYGYQDNLSNNFTFILNQMNSTQIIHYLTVSEFLQNGYVLCGVLFICTIVQLSLLQYHYFLVIREGIRVKTALQTIIYKKSLTISGLVISGGKMTIGSIMNHMTLDTLFIMMLFFLFHYIWAAPLQVMVAIILLYFKLGVSAVIGASIFILAAPLQYYIARQMSVQQKKVMSNADNRVKKCNEMIQSMRVIKLLAWEKICQKTINQSRKPELWALFRAAVFRIFFNFAGVAIPILGTMITFILYPYLEDEPLDAGKALSTLALFNVLRLPTILFTAFINSFINANVSAKRVIPYLLAEDAEGFNTGDKHKTHTIGTDTMEDKPMKVGVVVESVNGTGKPVTVVQNEMSGSQSSLESNLSRTPGHSRQNSHSSLKDIMELKERRHSEPNKTGSLTVNDKKETTGRQRHTSGVSTEDEDEIAEKFTLIEARMVVEINNGSFSWDLSSKEPTLNDINVKIPTGKLTIIVGSVGSGKTSLLSAMLGEMLTVKGEVNWHKGSKLAYAAQKAWLLHDTLRDNVLFGLPYTWRRYKSVIHSCALQPDLDMLPSGDSTEIGEKGINLSGGQKQRISIARALYSKADTVLLDDPFSALDAHVGKHVFEEAILNRMLKKKRTVILVTHQLQYLSYASHVIVMKEGGIQYQGKLHDVKKVNPELYESWRKALREASTIEPRESERPSESSTEMRVGSPHLEGRKHSYPSITELQHQSSVNESQSKSFSSNTLGRQLSQFSYNEEEEEPVIEFKEQDIEENEDSEASPLKSNTAEKDGKLIKKEHQEKGAVKAIVYLHYVKACGTACVILVLSLLVSYYALLVGSNFWLSVWSEDSTEFNTQLKAFQQLGNSTNMTAPVFNNTYYTNIYVALSVGGIMAALLAGLVLYVVGIRASRNLHKLMLDTILHVPGRFFDTNPSGRIINRFSNDMGQVDQKLPNILDNFLGCLFTTLCAVIVNTITTPYFLLAAIPLFILYYLIQLFFRASARELQRLDNTTKSPIFSHFSETLNGLQTIRAYRAEKRFFSKVMNLINKNNTPFLYMHTANRWLGVNLDYLGSIQVLFAAVVTLSSCLAGSTSPAFVGLGITYALQVSFYLNWIVRMTTETEMLMNSVERVHEYTKLEREPDKHQDGNLIVDESWPEKGEITFDKVSLRYDSHLDPVVTEASFTINAGEKVGLCGRTGSGKSSVTLSLFRMIDICGGSIIIDGKDIARVPLEKLRSQLAIIPQDPVLFAGSVRYNLDPTDTLDDEKLWSALETVQMKEVITALPDQLNSDVTEGGENFSVGQKQLFCLARAFLRNNKILVLDEATASIDLATDNKLQQVIFSAFKNKTIITIAHRISTIMNYDRVIVLDKGKVMEYESPKNLMKDKDSMFSALVKSVKNR
ncbi:ATP-binding cassette sub-family C member 9-like isoform X1 [Mytilus galloprovincialis]|uniref:ATP-binding cassette sub-family C member 9-like isoform X1 n=1 Tax=Mytilus galloprovincialis TaxID=29158 RepID=UPI003F7CB65D